ncbi:centromere protein H (CENP-H)-domain-containing protein [Dactylonectria estremocensis]|uniref:Centromere protein H (CENP-H)-domain-containing protein n=1 Tax=Dactylonectria estremocensis TaxID=1079267 RepID=A0A9P9JDX4_9HYPO|nr:centromere protein H (CENP-H)-domain-containing protein [Dactylonectria estremocensis]
MEEPTDQSMTDDLDEETHSPFSEDEKKVLALYDQLQELRLEIAIINGQRSHKPDEPSNYTPEDTRKAQADLLESRAKYVLRTDVIEGVMMVNPILKAVHNGTESSSVDRDLLPYVERRDDATISVAKQAAESDRQLTKLSAVQSEALRVSRQNVELAAELLKLAEEVKRKKTRRIDDPRTKQEQEALQAKVKESRQRWRVMKGVASGIVVGSGVAWAKNDELRETVLDPETEE